MKVVKFKRFFSRSQNPTRATSGSAGYDLILAENIEIKLNSLQKISTDIGLKIPKGNYER